MPTDYPDSEKQTFHASERQLALLMSNLPGVIFRCVYDRDWTMQFMSSGCYALTGYHSSELVGNTSTSYAELIHPEDRNYVWKEVSQAVSSQAHYAIEYRIRTRSGMLKHVWEKGAAVYRGSEVLFLEGFITDITARKEAEERLQRNQSLLEQTERIARMGGWEYHVQERVLTWTGEVYRIHGVTRDDYDPNDITNDLQFFAPEDRATLEKAFNSALTHGEPYDLELAFNAADGTDKWVRTTGQVEIQDGTIVRVFGHIIDITEQKETALALEKSEKLLQETGQIAKIGGWEFDPISLQGTWTKEVARIHDLDPDIETSVELGVSHYQGEDRQRIELAIAEAIETGKPYDLELEMITHAGNRKWVRSIAFPEMKDGKVVKMRGSFQDITDKKQIELSLVKSEKFLDETGRMAKVGGWVHDVNTGEVYWTHALYEILGFPPGESPPGADTHLDYYPQPYRNMLSDAYTRLLTDGTSFDLELQGYKASQELIWCRVYGEPVYHDGKITQVRGTLQDITKQKEAELLSRESQERFRQIAEYIAEIFYVFDLDQNRFLYLSPQYEKIWQQPVEDVYENAEAFTYSIHPEDMPKVNEAIRKEYKERIFVDTTYRIVRPDKTIRWIRSRDFPVRDESGHVTRVVGISEDITDAKEYENQIRSLSKFPDESPSPILRVTYDGKLLYCNTSGGILQPLLIGAKTKRLRRGWLHLISTLFKTNTILTRELPVGDRCFSLVLVPVVEQQYVNIYGSEITQLKRIQQELQRVTAAIQDARENERLRIARELHDELGQLLTGIKMDVSRCHRSIAGNISAETESYIQALYGIIDQTIDSVRRISGELRPVILDDFGIVAALEWYTGQFEQRFGITCQLVFPKRLPVIGTKLSAALYRIVLEALTNVARHARASRVTIRISTSRGGLRLIVKDDGVGINDKDIANSKSLGLIGIRERVREFGGTFNITSDEGTQVIVHIPRKSLKR